MIIYGIFTQARAFLSNENGIENYAVSQIKMLCDNEITKESKVRIMPDVHSGKGCVIGFTSTIGDKIIPTIVGVDLYCGMLLVELGKIDLDLEKIDNIILYNKNSDSGILSFNIDGVFAQDSSIYLNH